MKWQRALLPLALLGLLHSGSALSQPGMGMAGGMGIPGAERPMPRFDVAPQVGEQIPDVTIVDDQGNPVNIRELASESTYTVLTLGCLT